MNQKPHIDIAPEDLVIVKSILSKYVPKNEVWAFGSRVTGKARKYSDLDLAIINKQPLQFDLYAALKEAFSESTLPFKVDVVDWASIEENFRNIIKQRYTVLQKPISK